MTRTDPAPLVSQAVQLLTRRLAIAYIDEHWRDYHQPGGPDVDECQDLAQQRFVRILDRVLDQEPKATP